MWQNCLSVKLEWREIRCCTAIFWLYTWKTSTQYSELCTGSDIIANSKWIVLLVCFLLLGSKLLTLWWAACCQQQNFIYTYRNYLLKYTGMFFRSHLAVTAPAATHSGWRITSSSFFSSYSHDLWHIGQTGRSKSPAGRVKLSSLQQHTIQKASQQPQDCRLLRGSW